MGLMQARYAGRCAVCGKSFPAGTTIEYNAATREARHPTCQPVALPADAIHLSQGEGYGGTPYTVGEVIVNPRAAKDPTAPPYLYVLKASRQYFREDGYSFGVGAESGYMYQAACRVATPTESAPLHATILAARARHHAQLAIKEIVATIQREGEFAPDGTPLPEGDLLLDTRSLYGAGSVFVVTPAGVWYLEQHGMDGDDWGANNVAGHQRGWYLAAPSVGSQLRDLAAKLA